MTGPNKEPGGAAESTQILAQQATTIGSYSLAIAKARDASGVDSARIFKAVGIPTDLSNDPMSRLPEAMLTRLYWACVEATNNPYFGLTVAKHVQISNLHALGYSLAASSTLMDFCRRLERYFRLLSQTTKISLSEADEQVLLRFEQLVELSAETEDAFYTFLVLTMRHLYQQSFSPLRVEFFHSMPREGAGPYETVMRAPIQ